MATGMKGREVEEVLSSVLPSKRLWELSRASGFIKRKRKIDPVAFVWTLVLGFSAGRGRKLSVKGRANRSNIRSGKLIRFPLVGPPGKHPRGPGFGAHFEGSSPEVRTRDLRDPHHAI